MTNDEFKIESIFFQAVEIRRCDEREAYVEKACAGDVKLRRRVQKLLRARPKVGDFMEAGAEALAEPLDPPIRERPGDKIGHFKLLQEKARHGYPRSHCSL